MSFLNPLVLIGVLGIGLPILAHLINRQQVKRTDWAAMQFLNRSVRVRSRQIRLRDLLLLLMRCLALLLLVFAIARPASNSGGASWLPGESRAGVVVAIDASFSMAHRDASTTRFDRATELVNVISEHINPGDPVSLVMLGGEPRVVLRNAAFDPQRFTDVLAQQKPSPEKLDVQGTPKQLQSLVEDMDAIQKEIYIVTDTQAQDWGGDAAALRDAMRALTEQARVFIVPVPGGEENLAVTGLDLVTGELRRGTVARYRATVHNYGKRPVSDVQVRCRVEGVEIDSKQIPLIEPGASETVSLFVPFYNAGPTRLTAEISDDALPVDNVYHAVAVVRDRVSVLCIEGSTGGAGRLMLAGLLARPDGKLDEDYVVELSQWPAIPTGDLDRFDVVVLADVPEITPQQAAQLAEFVRQGNGLVWFAGENVKIDPWNKLLQGEGESLLPAKLGQVIDTSDSFGVGKPLDTDMPDHAVCRPLQSLAEDLLSETRFLKRMQVEPAQTSFAVLNLAGSAAPILLEHALGRGHVFMFTTSADTAWNNMALTPVFPMLMQQIVTYLAGREFEQPRIVGDALTLSYVEQPDANDAVFDSPSQQTITVPVRKHRERYMALLERSSEVGFYLARVSVQSPGMPIAVNVDAVESNVACLSQAELEQRLSGTGVTISASPSELAADINQARTARSAWRYFMMAGLSLLMMEALYADFMMRRKQTSPRLSVASPMRPEVATDA